MASIVSSTLPARRRLIRVVNLLDNMNRFEPQRLVTKERYWQFENADGVEFIAHGDASRHELLWRIIDELETT